MKLLTIAILTLVSTFVFSLVSAAQVKITFEDVTKNISERNYAVLSQAEKSYQAKLNIEQARSNLLPRLNIWSLARVAVDPLALLDVIPSVAPFLVPSNWFRLKETEALFYSEKEGYRALWANELSATHSLYFRYLMDLGLYQIVSTHYTDLLKLSEIARSRQLAGLEKIETVNLIQMQLLKIEDDQIQLKLLVDQEQRALSFSLGYPAETAIELEPIPLIKPTTESLLDYKIYVQRALDISPETRQYDNLFKVVPYLKQEVDYSFLGASQTSKGVAGGIFDNVVIADGLGFSSATTIKIINSQQKILGLQRTGVVETIKRQLQNVIGIYNNLIHFYEKTEQREALAISNIETLNFKFFVGQNEDLLLLADAYEVRTLSQAAKLEQLYRFLQSKDTLQRLIFSNEYSKLPATLEAIKK